MVDLKPRRRLATRVSKQLLKLKVDECATQCWNKLPIPWKHDQDTYQLRYTVLYSLAYTDGLLRSCWDVVYLQGSSLASVDLTAKKSRRGGNNAKSGFCITNNNVRRWFWTLRPFCMHSGARFFLCPCRARSKLRRS